MGKKKERTGDASRHLGKRRGRGGNPTDRARKAPSSNDLGVELRLMFYSARCMASEYVPMCLCVSVMYTSVSIHLQKVKY